MKAWKFLRKFEDNLKQYTTRRSKIVLDIGSNDCQNFPFLFHFHGFEKYIGIDMLCESKIFYERNSELTEIRQYYRDYQIEKAMEIQTDSFHKVYEKVCSGFSILKVQLDENNFNKHFSFIKKKINEKTNFQHLIKEYNDLIILSDFLHLFRKDKAQAIFRNAISTLKDSGFAYLTIPTEGYAKERKRKGSINIKWGINSQEVEGFISPLNIILMYESDNRINLLCCKNDIT